VATVSRLPLEPLPEPKHCARGEARVAVSKVAGVEIHNFYVPSGGDEPDPDVNDKFAHKLDFWGRLAKTFKKDRARLAAEPVIVVGDLNVAPGEHDVHNHKRLMKYVGHTPIEAEVYAKARDAGGFVDVGRALIPEPEQMPTWWSYRVKSWSPESPGWRLDHIWASPGVLGPAVAGGREAFGVHHRTRTWERPSDHVPVTLRFET
jgi:exodeoxyribonuclease-3